MIARISVLYLLTMSLLCSAQDQTAAFPGAEGFGRYTTGGRGGKVMIVTSLADDGPGSLRKALQRKEPRIIVFAVSGTIALESPLNINHGDVTIAGQTAPGDGICLKNYTVVNNADNVIIRYLRFRMGDERKFEGDAISGNKGNSNVIIDHCSMSWATDECASFYRNKNFTLQWCIISESLNHSVHAKGDHGYGGIWGGEKASFHHNLIADHNSRLPRFSGSSTTPNGPSELVDFRNNVIYNWMNNNTYGGERGHYNMVNNYYKPGPATKSTKRNQILDPWSPLGKFFVEGNFVHDYKPVSRNNKLGIKTHSPDSLYADVPFDVERIPAQTAEEACEEVLRSAGASLHRDAVDERVISEVKSGKAAFKNGIIDSQKDVGGWPVLKSTTPPADADQDGMPDEWEKRNHLDPADAADANKRSIDNTYDNIEVYINSLVHAPADRE